MNESHTIKIIFQSNSPTATRNILINFLEEIYNVSAANDLPITIEIDEKEPNELSSPRP